MSLSDYSMSWLIILWHIVKIGWLMVIIACVTLMGHGSIPTNTYQVATKSEALWEILTSIQYTVDYRPNTIMEKEGSPYHTAGRDNGESSRQCLISDMGLPVAHEKVKVDYHIEQYSNTGINGDTAGKQIVCLKPLVIVLWLVKGLFETHMVLLSLRQFLYC